MRTRLEVDFQNLSFSRAQPMGRHTIWGRQFPFVELGQRQGRVGMLPIQAYANGTSIEELDEIVSAGRAVIIQQPDGFTWYAVIGDLSEDFLAKLSSSTDPRKLVKLPLTQVGRP